MMWVLIIYVLSVIGAYYVNKLAYKLRVHKDSDIISWFIPCWNTVYILVLGIDILLKKLGNLNDIIENRWDK